MRRTQSCLRACTPSLVPLPVAPQLPLPPRTVPGIHRVDSAEDGMAPEGLIHSLHVVSAPLAISQTCAYL